MRRAGKGLARLVDADGDAFRQQLFLSRDRADDRIASSREALAYGDAVGQRPPAWLERLLPHHLSEHLAVRPAPDLLAFQVLHGDIVALRAKKMEGRRLSPAICHVKGQLYGLAMAIGLLVVGLQAQA